MAKWDIDNDVLKLKDIMWIEIKNRRYYDWMLWKLRQENPNWYSSDPKYEGERLVTKDNPNHHKIIKERFEHETERSIRQNLPLYRSLTGLGLAQEIAATNPELVIDLGCGANPFKGIIPNLVGMDLVKFPTSDLVMPIQNAHNIFQGAIADWVLILVSTHVQTKRHINYSCRTRPST